MIVFRTDASQKTGFGHLKRSAYLASLLRSKSDVLFCANKDKTVTRFLAERRFSHCSLKDLQRTHLKNPEIKSIVFDLRDFGSDDLQLLGRIGQINQNSERTVKTIQVTDLGLSQQDVDHTIDASVDKLFPYSPEKQETLLDGPDYMILHTRFRHFNKIKRKYRRDIKNVFICFGGGVQYRQLRRAVDLLSRHRYNIKIAPGFYLKKNSMKTLRRIYPGIRFVGETDTLARSFYEADIALISPGVAAFEAAAVGTPAVYVYYHKEQQHIAQSFENEGAGLEISKIDDIDRVDVDLIGKLKALTLDKRIEMGAKGKQLVDAGGVFRIIEFFRQNNII